MAGLTTVFAFLLASASTLHAEQYWVAYEGNDFPENEGWTRVTGAGGATRSIVDGALIVDSRDDVRIYDYSVIERRLDPGFGEQFVARWRLLVEEVNSSYPFDPGITVFSDESQGVAFQFSEGGLRSVFEDSVIATIAPGVYHTFELRSDDMNTYRLLIDNEFVHEGPFIEVFTASRVSWGDGIQGASSLSHWDYVRFGVTPEPSSLLLLGIGFGLSVRGAR